MLILKQRGGEMSRLFTLRAAILQKKLLDPLFMLYVSLLQGAEASSFKR